MRWSGSRQTDTSTGGVRKAALPHSAPLPHPASGIGRFAMAGLGAVSALFPLLVFLLADRLGYGAMVALLAVTLLARLLAGSRAKGMAVFFLAQSVAVGLVVALSLVDDRLAAHLYPVAISSALLVTFLASLVSGPPVIERIARLSEPTLPPEAVRYCRIVTWVWCGFFVLNGTVALLTVLHGDEFVWMIYNGFVSYLALGSLFLAEYRIRRRMRNREGIA